MKKMLGRWLVFGLLVLPAVPCRAGFDEGSLAYSTKDYATALREWLPLAKKGHSAAQFNLGLMYSNGRGVPKDEGEAVAWFRKAANQDNAEAQYNLGVMYGNGNGVPKDEREAVAWYRKAADQGNANGQNMRIPTKMTGVSG